MTTPSPKNIPLNKEHVEAYQAEVDAKREETKKTLSPDDLRRLEALEKASAILKEAGVEFYLHGVNAREKREKEGSGDWVFFWYKNEDESKYFEDGEKFGIQFVGCAIGQGEKFIRRGLSVIGHSDRDDKLLFIGPLCRTVLKHRAEEKGLTPPPDSL